MFPNAYQFQVATLKGFIHKLAVIFDWEVRSSSLKPNEDLTWELHQLDYRRLKNNGGFSNETVCWSQLATTRSIR